MCGIVGYVGTQQAAPILLEGLSRLEYRGYDSAGICVEQNGVLKVEKAKGRLQNLIAKTENGALLPGTLGIGHTRWATHGEPNDTNSHPHVSQNGKIAVVHNGIIENYLELREFLQQKGVKFASQTDTEVVAQLMEYCMGLPEVETVSDALYMVLHRIEGAYALGILCSDDPDHVYAARKDAPLLIGFGCAPVYPCLIHGTPEHFGALKAHLLDGLSALGGITVNSGENCVPNIVNFSVEGVRSEIMLHSLEERGIYVSSGSACSRGKTSGVLAAFGIPDKLADSAIRVSMCADTTEADIDALIEGIRAGIARFRR